MAMYNEENYAQYCENQASCQKPEFHIFISSHPFNRELSDFPKLKRDEIKGDYMGIIKICEGQFILIRRNSVYQ
jgi:hypothetical protein